LAGVVTCKEVYRNLMPPEETKVSFFPFIGPFKQLLIGGITAFRIQFYGYTKRKKTHTMTFLQGEYLKPLDNRIGLHIFLDLESEDHFAMTLYVIGNSWWAASLWSATGVARPWRSRDKA